MNTLSQAVSQEQYVTLKHLNEYFASLKSQLAEKVGLSEVQLALAEMQRKLQLTLIQKEQESQRILENLKSNFNAKLAKIVRRMLDKSSILNDQNWTGQHPKISGIDQNSGSEEIVTAENFGVIITEIEGLRTKIEGLLNREGNFRPPCLIQKTLKNFLC